jgi:hypothetical protein
MNANSMSSQGKVHLFRTLFAGLDHVYGIYDLNTGKVSVIKRNVTDSVIYNHLKGIQPYGVYLLTGDRTKAVVVDFDSQDTSLPLIFVERAKHYQLPCYIERSKSKGYHMWLFFESNGVLASKARMVVHHILQEIEFPHTEVFPKQDTLTPEKPFGNFINTPLFGAFVPKGKTVFVNPDDGLRPFVDQWKVLQNIILVSELQLNEIIEINELTQETLNAQLKQHSEQNQKSQFTALLPCARTILEQGVNQYQRVTCFRLAVHLKRIGFSKDITISILHAWSKKNHPVKGKYIITEQEIIEQVQSAYNRSYRSYGCEDAAIKPFCDTTCPIYQKNHAVSC